MTEESPVTLVEEESDELLATEASADFLSLDSLLAESLAMCSQKVQVASARKTLAKGQASPEERAKLLAIVAEWEIKREWKVVGKDAMFEVQQCTCGAVHHHLLGIFQRQQHRVSEIDRWVAEASASQTIEQLPRGVKENLTYVSVCIKCAWRSGWGVPV